MCSIFAPMPSFTNWTASEVQKRNNQDKYRKKVKRKWNKSKVVKFFFRLDGPFDRLMYVGLFSAMFAIMFNVGLCVWRTRFQIYNFPKFYFTRLNANSMHLLSFAPIPNTSQTPKSRKLSNHKPNNRKATSSDQVKTTATKKPSTIDNNNLMFSVTKISRSIRQGAKKSRRNTRFECDCYHNHFKIICWLGTNECFTPL